MLFYLALTALAAYLTYRFIDVLYRKPAISCSGRYVLVTGTDTGFGHALTRRLDAKGCHVIATYMTAEGEEELKRNCSDRLNTIHMDISDTASVAKVYEFVKEILPHGKGLWGIVNNAGTPGRVFGPLEWLTTDNYKDINAINLFGLINLTMTFLPMIKASRGRVVNMASVHGRTCLHGNVPYSCSKYGVEAFSDSLRRQLLPYGCSVHVMEPGFHRTNIINRQDNEKQLRAAWEQASPETKEEFGPDYLEKAIDSYLDQVIPMIASKRIDDVIDAYEHALFAVRPRARYVLGFDANYFWLPVQCLPEWLGDWIQEVLTPSAPVPSACRNL